MFTFFANNDLDILSITESWIFLGDLATIAELLSAGCTYFNTPRKSGSEGGLLTILKSAIACNSTSILGVNPSVEVSAFELGSSSPTFCALLYRPPKYNKDFTTQFSDFFIRHFFKL